MIKPRCRNAKASSMAEFAVALPLLLLMVFLPMLCLINIYGLYSAADSLNKLQSDEAVLLPFKQCLAERGPVRKDIPDAWLRSGLASYAKPIRGIQTEISYSFASLDDYGFVNQWVDVDTTFSIEPFLNLAYVPAQVPGLNAPCSFTFHSRKLVEDPTNAPPLLASLR